jgi:hypothetical protein
VFLTSIILSIVTGLGVRAWLARDNGARQITWVEYGAGVALLVVAIAPLTNVIGTTWARNSLLQYEEFWGGFELTADSSSTVCQKDGNCRRTYDCDPYTVMVTKTRTNADGEVEAYTDTETRYHSCPWTTTETTYTVTTTFDTHVIGASHLPADPEANRWTGYGYSRKAAPSKLPRGVPPLWQDARDRMIAGRPGPASVMKSYDNYLLASGHTILLATSDAVDGYVADGLLPRVPDRMSSPYTATKLQTVGAAARHHAALEDAVGRTSATLGVLRQGDLHVVVVDDAEVDDADRYAQAMRAYWLSPEMGRHAVAKNAIVVVLGTDATSVVWARAFTGMPLGNEQLSAAVARTLPDMKVNGATLIGEPDATVNVAGDGIDVAPGNGALERLLFAEAGGYQRACMTCEDDDDSDVIGFAYLRDEIQPTAGQRAAMALMSFVLSSGAWAAFAHFGTPRRRSRRTW